MFCQESCNKLNVSHCFVKGPKAGSPAACLAKCLAPYSCLEILRNGNSWASTIYKHADICLIHLYKRYLYLSRITMKADKINENQSEQSG